MTSRLASLDIQIFFRVLLNENVLDPKCGDHKIANANESRGRGPSLQLDVFDEDQVPGQILETDEWPMPAVAFAHPRSTGTFTRLLAEWVRERKLLSLSDAIRKSSLIPAQILESSVPQMKKKARLQVGMDADVIVFDPATVQDRATYTNPAQPSVGMKYVQVNGVPVIANGELVRNARPGKPVRRRTTASD